MPPTKSINMPAGYAPAFAIGYSNDAGELAIVDMGKPLPVVLSGTTPLAVNQADPEPAAPLEGTANVSALAGPFVPATGRPIVITLSGDWVGEVQVERSSNAGATRHPLTAAGTRWGHFISNACEIVWEEREAGVELYLDIAISSGTLAYRIAQ